MITISLCMIVKNEAEVIEDCLKSVQNLVDEIIIVDTGSTDNTKAIVQNYTPHIYDFTWVDDFSQARNYAFKLATKDYILWLDADDLIPQEAQEKFLELKQNLPPDIDAVSMLYHLAFDECGHPTFSYRRNRLVKREKQFKWIGAVHEYLAVSGKIYESDIAIIHQKHKKSSSTQNDRNLKIYQNLIQKGETLSPRDLYYFANELREHKDYLEALKYYQQFLATKQGWIEDVIQAYIYMGYCHQMLGHREQEINCYLETLKYGQPRPEVSCRLGDLYQERNYVEKAILWYQLAMLVDLSQYKGFVNKHYSTWYPALQLAQCYLKLGQLQIAEIYLNKAKLHYPNHPLVLKIHEALIAHKINENQS